MSQGFVYQLNMNAVSVSTAKSLVQIKMGSAAGQLLRAWVSQSSSTTSTMQQVALVRGTSAGTGTAGSIVKQNLNNPASLVTSSTTTGATNITAEGTVVDTLYVDAFNILNGWLWVPTPEERIVVAQGGFLALKFIATPASAITVSAGIVWEEWI